jgi:hypothetical protein
MYDPSQLTNMLNCILFLDHKLTLLKYNNITSTLSTHDLLDWKSVQQESRFDEFCPKIIYISTVIPTYMKLATFPNNLLGAVTIASVLSLYTYFLYVYFQTNAWASKGCYILIPNLHPSNSLHVSQIPTVGNTGLKMQPTCFFLYWITDYYCGREMFGARRNGFTSAYIVTILYTLSVH